MPWNVTQKLFVRETPTYSGPDCWKEEADNDYDIDPVRSDFHDQDIAEGISQCVNVNGLTGMQANLAMGDNLITGLADGVNPTDAATKQQVDAVLPTAPEDGSVLEYGVSWDASTAFKRVSDAAWIGSNLTEGLTVWSFIPDTVVVTASEPGGVGTPKTLTLQGSDLTLQATTGNLLLTTAGDVQIDDNLIGTHSSGYVNIGRNQVANTFLSVHPESGDARNIVDMRDEGGVSRLLLDANGLFAVPSIYSSTTGTSANVYVDSAGQMYRSSSSLRYKQDISDISNGLDAVIAMRPVTFASKDKPDTRYSGFIAEEIDELGLTGLVEYDESGRPDALNYDRFTAVLVKAVQELTARVEALEA